jgi:acyl-CoA thioesterase-1
MLRHLTLSTALFALLAAPAFSADNALTDEERQDGWQLLFDGQTTKGWMSIQREALPERHVQDGSLNPHPCNYMLITEKPWGDFVLALDFKLSRGCNSGIFFRTWPLEPRPGRDIGFNGLELAIDDTTRAGLHDTGAIYDLVPPKRNAIKPAGEWNHVVLTCNDNLVTVDLNGERVTELDLDQWTEPGLRPDGTNHKFTETAYQKHPRRGYIGLQDHGADCWYRNIKLRPLGPRAAARAPARPNPVFAKIVDDPGLPRVLLIGDSISMGYTLPVRERLQGRANVHRIPTNGGPTTRGLEAINAWLGDGKWDAIHFNWGLHDLKYVNDAGQLADVETGRPQVPLEQYEQNLRRLVARLQQTGARLIWCTTTPVPEGSAGRRAGDEAKYNESAAKVMAELGVTVNDLCAFAQERLADIQRPANVHFTPRGSDALAGQVADSILKALGKPD